MTLLFRGVREALVPLSPTPPEAAEPRRLQEPVVEAAREGASARAAREVMGKVAAAEIPEVPLARVPWPVALGRVEVAGPPDRIRQGRQG